MQNHPSDGASALLVARRALSVNRLGSRARSAGISTIALAVALVAAASLATPANAAHSKPNDVDCPKPEVAAASSDADVLIEDGTCDLQVLSDADLDNNGPPGGGSGGGDPGGGDPGGDDPGGGDPGGGDPGGGDPGGGGDPSGGGGSASGGSAAVGDHTKTGEDASDAGSGAIGAGQGAIGAGQGAIGAGSHATGAGRPGGGPGRP